jgi:dTDP-4-dehydrorhamnose 3,5-epimerase
MKIIETALNGVSIIQADIFKDNRGYFTESYHQQKLNELGISATFLQDNFSLSDKNVLRGMHFQNPPYEQGKLIKVVSGAVQDIVVDLRKSSPTYGQSFSIVLQAEDHLMLWIPPGFAHGFLALENKTMFYYKCTNFYNKQSESGICFDDVDLNLKWAVQNPILSEKDRQLPSFNQAAILF